MKWLFLIYFVCLFSPHLSNADQKKPLQFSGKLLNAPFSEFADSIESQNNIAVYYKSEWVQQILVTLIGKNLPLIPVLDSILGPEKLTYFVDDYQHLFIYNDSSDLLVDLPKYVILQQSESIETSGTNDASFSAAEQTYSNSRKILDPETIQIGSVEKTIPGKSVIVTGSITDYDNGEPIVGANLYIPETQKGTTTNANGYFQFSILPGQYEMECTSMGMQPLAFKLIVHSDGEMQLSMKKTLIPLDEVIVKSTRYNNVKGTQMGFESLNYSVLKEIPLVMGERDIINVVKLLPGIQSVGEGAQGYNVRGSSADQNMVYINKVPVYNPSHLFGFFTSFSPEIVADFTLYKSNFPASFGGRLASFFDVRSKQGNMKQFSARAGISAISAYAAMEIPIIKDKSSVILSGRSTYSDWILKKFQDPVLRNSEAGFNDFSSVLTFIPNERTRIKAFGYHSNDRFNLGDQNSYNYGNSGASIDINRRFNQRLNGNFALVFSNYQFSTSDIQQPSSGYIHDYKLMHSELKSDFTWLSSDWQELTAGTSIIYYHLNRGSVNPFGSQSLREPLDLGSENGIESAMYVGDNITINDRFSAYAGLRVSAFMALGPSTVRTYSPGMPMLDENVTDTLYFDKGKTTQTYFGIEPRINLRYLTGNNSSLKFSYNRSTQYLFMLSNTIALSPTDQWKLSDYHIGPESLDQVSLGFYKDFPEIGVSTSLETYFKWGHNILAYRDGANLTDSRYVESETLQGKQRSYGIETMIRKNSGIVNGWLTYSYARSFMQVDDPNPIEQINKGKPFPSNYDRPHSFTMVTNFKRGRRVSYSANIVYMTGRPATYPVSVYYEYDMPYINYSDRNKYRLPDYFRIDISMNMEGNLKKNKLFHSFWMFNVYNLTGRKNAYSVYFKNLDGQIQGYKLSIFAQPIFTVSWNIKLGNYASE